MANDTSKEISKLALPFHKVANDIKGLAPLWEELAGKACKVQRVMEAASSVMLSFLETLQKVADGASSSRGSTRDLGVCLTKITLRHRNIAQSYNKVGSSFGDSFAKMLTQKMEERRKAVSQLEREHEKDFKHWKADLKKANTTTMKLTKEAQKKKTKDNISEKLEESLESAVEQYEEFEAYEQLSLRQMLLEERRNYCALLESIQPFLEAEVAFLDEVYQLQEIQKDSAELISNIGTLPQTGMDIANDLQLDLPRIFKGACPSSPALAQMRKQADDRLKARGSLLNLVPSENLSIDSMSISESMGQSSGSASASISLGSPSLNAVRLEPEGSSGSRHTPEQEPEYADIGAMQGMSVQPLETAPPPSSQAFFPPLANTSRSSIAEEIDSRNRSASVRSRVAPENVPADIYTMVDPNDGQDWEDVPDDLPLPPPPDDLGSYDLPLPVKSPVQPMASSTPYKAPVPEPVQAAVPAPVKAAVPVPVKAAVPVPVKAAVPSPVKAPVAAPVKATVPTPIQAAIASPPAAVSGLVMTPSPAAAQTVAPAMMEVKHTPPQTRPKPGRSGSLTTMQYDYVQVPSTENIVPGSEYAAPRPDHSPLVNRRSAPPSTAAPTVCEYEDPDVMVDRRRQNQAPITMPGYAMVSKPATSAMVSQLRQRTASGSSADFGPPAGSSSPRLPGHSRGKSRLPPSGQQRPRSGTGNSFTMTMDV